MATIVVEVSVDVFILLVVVPSASNGPNRVVIYKESIAVGTGSDGLGL